LLFIPSEGERRPLPRQLAFHSVNDRISPPAFFANDNTMTHDVFISYSHHDKSAADAVCAKLEQHGIRCWIAPRDVEPGTEWAGSIIHAISKSKIMVLVFSNSANNSPQIRKEVERAVNKGVIVVPLRIEDVVPTDSLEYFMSNVHWLDALTPPLEKHLDHLAGTVKIMLDRMESRDEPPPPAPGHQAPPPTRPHPQPASDSPAPVESVSHRTAPPPEISAKKSAWTWPRRIIAAAVLLIILFAVIYFVSKPGFPPQFVQARVLSGALDKVNFVTFSPDGRWLASGHMDGSIILWDPSTGQRVRTLTGHARYVTSLAFSPDGRLLASGSDDYTVKLWDPNSGSVIRTMNPDSTSVRSVAFSPDGKLLASGTKGGNATFWNPLSGEPLKSLPRNGFAGIWSVAFSADGLLFASGESGGIINFWNVQTGTSLHKTYGYGGSVNTLAFSPDSRLLAAANDNSTVELWNTSTGASVRKLNGCSALDESAEFSPDGRVIAAACTDRTIRLWNVQTGSDIGTLWGHTDWVQSVAFSPNGKLLASGSADRTIIIWRRSN
jgi:WD40 repeat protein